MSGPVWLGNRGRPARGGLAGGDRVTVGQQVGPAVVGVAGPPGKRCVDRVEGAGVVAAVFGSAGVYVGQAWVNEPEARGQVGNGGGVVGALVGQHLVQQPAGVRGDVGLLRPSVRDPVGGAERGAPFVFGSFLGEQPLV